MDFPIRLDRKTIQDYLPHRGTALMLHEGEILSPLSSRGSFRFTPESYPMFEGHYPGYPVVRGVDLVEAVGLTASLIIRVIPEFQGLAGLFREIVQARFKAPVVPGDTVELSARITSTKLVGAMATGEFEGSAAVKGKTCITLRGRFIAAPLEKMASLKR